MKQIYIKIGKHSLLAAACLASFIFSGCSKSASPAATVTQTSPYVMTATIGSTPFSCDSCEYVSLISFPSTPTDPGLQIYSWNGQNAANSYPQINLEIVNFAGVGTYSMTPSTASNFLQGSVMTSATAVSYAVSGIVTISSISPSVVGTFNFTTMDGTVVSNGKFTALAD